MILVWREWKSVENNRVVISFRGYKFSIWFIQEMSIIEYSMVKKQDKNARETTVNK